MTTLLTDEQLLLRDSAREFLAGRYPMTWVREWTEADPERRRAMHGDLWKELAGLGWLGLLWPEDCGGIGLGYVEQTIVLEELGRGVVPTPYLSTLLGASVVARADDDGLRRDVLSAVSGGEMTLGLACAEQGGDDPGAFATQLAKDGTLSGTKLFVPDADLVDRFVVPARVPGAGLCWALVEHDAQGVRVEPLDTMDATRPLHRVIFEGSPAVRVGNFVPVWEQVEPLHWLALAAEGVGGSEQVLQDAVAYAKERVQFDTPIGANQAIKHKCSNMLIRVEGARAITYHAARELDADAASASLACSMAKAYATEAYLEVASEGIQIHGGVGFTWEFDCHLFYKRARANEIAAGHPDEHRERVAAGAGL